MGSRMFSKILTVAAATLSTSNAAYLRGRPGNSTTSTALTVPPSKALVVYRDPSLKPTTCLVPPPTPWYSLATNTTGAAK